jgi:hypothetical protein
MVREITINQGVIGGVEKDLIVGIFPQLETSFRQRKEFYEYYFTDTEIELTLEQLEELSYEFSIVLNRYELKIK